MPKKKPKGDFLLFCAVIILVSIGLVIVFSATSVMGIHEFRNPFYHVRRQAIFAILGFIAMVFVSRIDYHLYKPLALPGVALSFFLLVLVLAIARDISGAKRWIEFGTFSIQPSEVAKLAMVNFTAVYIANKKAGIRKFFTGLFPVLGILGAKALLILVAPDFGTAVALCFTILVVLFAGGAHLGHLFFLALSSLPVLWYGITKQEYRVRRILAFLDPWADPTDTGWNIIQSLLAIGSGGLFGLGLGNSRQKFAYLPEHHTDFIFSILGEELGFLGTSLVVFLFLLLAYRGLWIALHAKDTYGCLLAVGITTMVVFQAFLNMGVVTGSLPVTGIPLPFISHGGSSLLMSMIGMGILLNVSRHIEV